MAVMAGKLKFISLQIIELGGPKGYDPYGSQNEETLPFLICAT